MSTKIEQEAIQIRCIIVDDEPMARDVLRRYIQLVPALTLVEEFSNAVDAFMFLQVQQIDLIFLDIRMPEMTGIQFLQSLRNPPQVIFTTAYKEYALDGYDLDALDFLLKPIRFERFLRSVQKAFPQRDMQGVQISAPVQEIQTAAAYIYLRSDRKLVKVILDEILYIESKRDHIQVVTANETYMARQTISSLESMLPSQGFVRIHRSFIVSVGKIKSFSSETVQVGDHELPVGRLYREQFLSVVK